MCNPGTLDPRIFFEKLIIPHSGRQPGVDRASHTSDEAPPAEILFKRGAAGNRSSTVVVQVAGMGVETFTLKGLGLPEHRTLNLPPQVNLNVSRSHAVPDTVLEQALPWT